MIEYIIMFIAILGCLLAILQRDLLKASILTAITGICVTVLFQILLAPDVALTQAIVGSAIVPALLALAVKKTERSEDDD